MDSIFGITGKGFTLLVADCSSLRSILAYKHDEDKVRVLDSHKACAAAGPQADCVQFVEYIQRNIALKEYQSGLKSSTKATASYIRTELATALRRNPYQVNLLIGGFDKDEVGGSASASSSSAASAASGTASLYFMDYLGSMQKMNYGAHGYAGYFIFSTMDRHWRPDMSLEEALALARMCIKELHTRFLVNQPAWTAKVVGADGIKVVPIGL